METLTNKRIKTMDNAKFEDYINMNEEEEDEEMHLLFLRNTIRSKNLQIKELQKKISKLENIINHYLQ